MQKGHILALCVAIAVIFAIWTGFLLAVVTGLMPGSILPGELNTLASVGDTFGILNSLFTGVALAAIVVAIFMQAQQLHEQVETNNLYKQEVAATLENLERENAWKSVESKMHLIPLLSETYEKELTRLVEKHRVGGLDPASLSALYKSRDALTKISEAIAGYRAYQDQLREGALEKKSALEKENDEFIERMEELKAAKEDVTALEASYANAWLRLKSDGDSINARLDQITESIEAVTSMRAILTDLQRLNDEYERAFQKAYEMTS
ncbi:hypothetical protein GU927_019400 [Rhodobacteraceae bacterium HSP-20]|uniref:MotA/TolQ/ExbB proton channel domain-containing protein n=1 Tax=Paragemmobacter amnigenus TaxID=2852097 RepID=A0ABS6J8F9_9RHOB|nr:hypothetical protein [Rhodobacter amnigenus]MBU9700013.1 hypothetical protein [Rhodobacter amnigenus]MBV4391240.1 hypothetical protein [Rhodobacter amnigenus]